MPKECTGALVLLGDMPRIEAAHLDAIIAAFASEAGAAIVVLSYQGQRGNPVLWPAELFGQMLALEGDVGAQLLTAKHAQQVREIDLGTDAVLTDIDTPEALARSQRGRHRRAAAARRKPQKDSVAAMLSLGVHRARADDDTPSSRSACW